MHAYLLQLILNFVSTKKTDILISEWIRLDAKKIKAFNIYKSKNQITYPKSNMRCQNYFIAQFNGWIKLIINPLMTICNNI